MGGNVLVDAGFIVALLSRRDSHHLWAVSQAAHLPPPGGPAPERGAAAPDLWFLVPGIGAQQGPLADALLAAGRGVTVVDGRLVEAQGRC